MKEEEQRWLVVRFPYGRPAFSIEYGDHRCHSDKSREPPTTRRIPIPASWNGTLSDIIRHYRSKLIGGK